VQFTLLLRSCRLASQQSAVFPRRCIRQLACLELWFRLYKKMFLLLSYDSYHTLWAGHQSKQIRQRCTVKKAIKRPKLAITNKQKTDANSSQKDTMVLIKVEMNKKNLQAA